VTNGIPLGSSLLLPVCTVNCVQTLKALAFDYVTKHFKQIKRQVGTLLAANARLRFKDVAICVNIAAESTHSIHKVSEWKQNRGFPPGWFYPGTEVFASNAKQFVADLDTYREPMTTEQLLVCTFAFSGGSSVLRLAMADEITGDSFILEADFRAAGSLSDAEYETTYKPPGYENWLIRQRINSLHEQWAHKGVP
jgi:hypothetical protein